MGWAWVMAIVQTIACAFAAASVLMALATRRRIAEMATHHKVALDAWETENRSLRSLVGIQTAMIDAQARQIIAQDNAVGLMNRLDMSTDRVAGEGTPVETHPSPTRDPLTH